jgi:hypothetical protein
MKQKFKFAIPAVLAFSLALVATAQDSETRHLGYEHGYRDGYSYGHDAKAHGVALNPQGDAYEKADHGFRAEYGPKEEYETGYREGYRMGADDGYANSRTRFEKMFADQDYAPPANNHWRFEDLAQEMGYRDGVKAGVHDVADKHSFRPTEHDQWKDGDRGYHDSLGSKEAYKAAYRKAYEAGYRDGYGPPRG